MQAQWQVECGGGGPERLVLGLVVAPALGWILGDHCAGQAQAGGVLAEPRDGQQQAEECEAGHGLDDVGYGDDGFGEALAAGEENAEREADAGREQHGAEREPQVLEGEASDLVAVDGEEAMHQ